MALALIPRTANWLTRPLPPFGIPHGQAAQLGAMANFMARRLALFWCRELMPRSPRVPCRPARQRRANQSTEITSLATIATNTGAAVPAGTNLIGNVGQVYPGRLDTHNNIRDGHDNRHYCNARRECFSPYLHLRLFNPRQCCRRRQQNDSTVTGVVTGTLHFTQWTAPNASGVGVTEEVFSPCIISSATNTGIAVISGAPGTSGIVSVTAWG